MGGSYQIGRVIAPLDLSTRFGQGSTSVLVAGESGAWDDGHLKDPFVLYDAGVWKLWYAGYDGAKYQIGYATSSDNLLWIKSGSSPVIAVGGSGAWDESGTLFPVVYKDLTADASRRYRMLYTGKNAAGLYQTGYAYSADGISWTKGASNPVVAVGAGGSWEDVAALTGCLAKDGSTYSLFYGGNADGAWPETWQVGRVTFTDFEGTYTKDGGNPVIPRRTGDQALTSNLAQGGATVAVADTSGFAAGETVWLTNGSVGQQVDIQSVDSATGLTLATVARVAFTTAAGSRIISTLVAVTPRSVFWDGTVWRMLLTAFQAGKSGPEIETTYQATAASLAGPWTLSHDADSPPLPLNGLGVTGAWDAWARENPALVLDAATYTPIALAPCD